MPKEKMTYGADGWSIPNEWGVLNNALETRTDITGYPDVDGNIVANASNPGGFQIGRDVYTVSGSGSKIRVNSGQSFRNKRNVPTQDMMLVLAYTDTGGNLTWEAQFNQEW